MKSHMANLPGEKPSVLFAYSVWPTSSMCGAIAWLIRSVTSCRDADPSQFPGEHQADDRRDHQHEERPEPPRVASLRGLEEIAHRVVPGRSVRRQGGI